MDSLESKLSRLTPDQHREVEDFVDFLIQRAEGIRVTVQVSSHDTQPLTKSVAPPLIITDPVVADEPVISPRPVEYAPPAPPVAPARQAESPVIIQEIGGGDAGDSRDGYLDYGTFEKSTPSPLPPSPADEAVKKVKRRLIQKSEQAQKNQLLDWID
ncbi:MAG TPA: hypothetical protein PKM50_07505 [Methanoregula sp.]|nr:hypothetical protein [Methanoregula sp.]